jgi:hypothetical protein
MQIDACSACDLRFEKEMPMYRSNSLLEGKTGTIRREKPLKQVKVTTKGQTKNPKEIASKGHTQQDDWIAYPNRWKDSRTVCNDLIDGRNERVSKNEEIWVLRRVKFADSPMVCIDISRPFSCIA